MVAGLAAVIGIAAADAGAIPPVAGGLAILLLVVGAGGALRLAGLARREATSFTRLSTESEILRALLGTTGDGVLLVDPEGIVRRFNPGAEILFARASDEVLGCPVCELVPGLGSTAPGSSTPESATPESATLGHGHQALPRTLELTGLRHGEAFALRLIVRQLAVDGASWQLVLAEDLAESEQVGDRLELLETHDSLTGLANRRALERALARIGSTAGALATPEALCLLDLDRFKLINAACGHGAGDKALQQVARLLAVRFPQASLLARVGADELAALFPAPSPELAESACEDLLRTVRGFPFACGDRTHDLTASAALVLIASREDAAAALRRADIACHLAQSNGGDRLVVHGREGAGRRDGIDLDVVSGIGAALADGRLSLAAQPIRSLKDPALPPHWEVLVRMRDANGGAIDPASFIPGAERYVLMPAVDRWIITRVLEQEAERLRAWHACYPDRFLLAINLSATSLADDAFLPFIEHQMETSRVPWSSICFELTESAALCDVEHAGTVMGRLHALGCRFAVDDFGTGFASYGYLKSLPLSYLKIDGAFVRGAHANAVDRALIESINRIGHLLGLKTIAEWVESDAVLEVVRAIGVDYAQGHAVGGSMDLADLPWPGVLPVQAGS